jgi:hypothetical protein
MRIRGSNEHHLPTERRAIEEASEGTEIEQLPLGSDEVDLDQLWTWKRPRGEEPSEET